MLKLITAKTKEAEGAEDAGLVGATLDELARVGAPRMIAACLIRFLMMHTDPRFPGVSITIPAGVTITGWDGTVKTQIALERLSPEALPVPPPPGETRSLYQVFFGTPMGGVPSAPLPVTVPNDQALERGEKAEIWYYNAAPIPGAAAAWRLDGLGTVSADGSRVVSDPGVGISRFCGVCGSVCIIKNLIKQAAIMRWAPTRASSSSVAPTSPASSAPSASFVFAVISFNTGGVPSPGWHRGVGV